MTPRALTIPEIKAIEGAYRAATRRALDAGFDGVELHGATGYLPEQFLSSGSNLRTDAYGGSVENRARFLLETLDGMIAEAGEGRVGLKLSPESHINDIRDDTPRETFTYLVEHLPAAKMAYLNVTLFHFVEPSGRLSWTAEAALWRQLPDRRRSHQGRCRGAGGQWCRRGRGVRRRLYRQSRP